jgi:hypothetical protein
MGHLAPLRRAWLFKDLRNLQLSPSKPIYAGSRYSIRYSPIRRLISDPKPPFHTHPPAPGIVTVTQFSPQKGLTALHGGKRPGANLPPLPSLWLRLMILKPLHCVLSRTCAPGWGELSTASRQQIAITKQNTPHRGCFVMNRTIPASVKIVNASISAS